MSSTTTVFFNSWSESNNKRRRDGRGGRGRSDKKRFGIKRVRKGGETRNTKRGGRG